MDDQSNGGFKEFDSKNRRCASAYSPIQKLCGNNPEGPLEFHNTRVLWFAPFQINCLLDRSQIPAR